MCCGSNLVMVKGYSRTKTYAKQIYLFLDQVAQITGVLGFGFFKPNLH